MEHRRIGSLEVTLAGIGCNNFGTRMDESAAKAVVDAALDAGINHFDTAQFYGSGLSEEYLGRALGARRPDVVLTTKFGIRTDAAPHPGSRGHVAFAVEDSLRRLGTDYIDLYLLHRPDPTTPVAETIAAMEELRTDGKVREIGWSGVSVEQLAEAVDAANELGVGGFVNVQNEYSVLVRDVEDEVIPICRQHGITLVPYTPLAAGLLSGKYRRGVPATPGTRLSIEPYDRWLSDERLDAVERLEKYATDHGHSLLELAFAYLTSEPTVPTVIAGASTPAQALANVTAVTAWTMSEAQRGEVRALLG